MDDDLDVESLLKPGIILGDFSQITVNDVSSVASWEFLFRKTMAEALAL